MRKKTAKATDGGDGGGADGGVGVEHVPVNQSAHIYSYKYLLPTTNPLPAKLNTYKLCVICGCVPIKNVDSEEGGVRGAVSSQDHQVAHSSLHTSVVGGYQLHQGRDHL